MSVRNAYYARMPSERIEADEAITCEDWTTVAPRGVADDGIRRTALSAREGVGRHWDSFNLPVRRTRLIGREAEQPEIRDLVLHGDRRLVTLVGAPGAGKTSLAFEVGREAVNHLTDGVCLVGLELADANSDLASLCGDALGLTEESGSQPLARLQSYLQPRQLLLLVDNCEHVGEASGSLINTLLSHCPGLRVLATSRVPLKLSDEAVYYVEPLALPDDVAVPPVAQLAQVPAVALFVERARAARHTFRLTTTNASAVVHICRSLGGLPLALELAAARVAAFSPQQIAERLASAELLRGRRLATPTRHETVAAALDWSYDLLSDREQQLFRRLGGFPSRWTLKAAEAICTRIDGEASDALPTLAVLVEHSLISADEVDGTNRYSTLMPIREYAIARLREAGELVATFRAYARYYREYAETASSTKWAAPSLSPEQLGQLHPEYESLLAALRWAEHDADGATALRICLALWVFWRIRGDLRTADGHLRAALSVADSAAPGLRAMALLEASNFAQLVGDPARSEALATEALVFFRNAKDPHAEAYALALLADVALGANDLEQASELYTGAFRIGEESDSISVTAWSLGGLSEVAERRGCDEEAQSLLEQARTLLDVPDAPSWLKGRFEAQLGRLVRRRGNAARASELVREAVRLLQPLEARNELLPCIEELARAAIGEGQPTRAALLFGAASALRESTGAILTDADAQSLMDDIETVRHALGDRSFTETWARGRTLSPTESAAAALGESAIPIEPATGALLSILTPREREVAQLVAEGLTNAAIAERLVVSEGTSRTHVERIRRKLGSRSRAEIARIIAEEGPGSTD